MSFFTLKSAKCGNYNTRRIRKVVGHLNIKTKMFEFEARAAF